jgi:Ca2+-binding EF-hand superfamily protein
VPIDKFKLGLEETFKHFDIEADESQVDEIINQVDRFQKGYLEMEDFCEAFDKVFSLYLKMKNL